MSGLQGWLANCTGAASTAAMALFFWADARGLESGAASVGELLKIQAQVQSTLDKVLSAVVAVQSNDGAASGVIVSADGLVMTATHVTGEPGRKVVIRLADGRPMHCRTLGVDKSTDAALMRIESDRKNWPHVPLCRDLRVARPGAWCFALGHPGGYDPARGPVLRVGRVLKQTANALQTDCVLMGGDSGGPLFSVNGEVIGIHSQIYEGRDQNMHVSVAPYLRAWEHLKQSVVVRTWNSGVGGWLGVATTISPKAELEVANVAKGSPADHAGLRSGDVIVSLDGEIMLDQPQFSSAISSRPAGETVALRIRNQTGDRLVEVELARRPEDG